MPTAPQPSRTDARPTRRAFTLVELLAVIAILGMFASVTTIVVRGSISAAREQLDWQRVQSMDAQLRAQCRRLRQPATVRLNLDTGTWERRTVGMQPLRVAETRSLKALLSHGQVARSGEVTVVYRADGTSDSYAVSMSEVGPQQPWRLVCGGTGQWVEELSHETVRTLQQP